MKSNIRIVYLSRTGNWIGTKATVIPVKVTPHKRGLFLIPTQRRVMNTIAQRLVSLCATLGEFPHVRFAADGRGRTEEVARIFQVGLYVTIPSLRML